MISAALRTGMFVAAAFAVAGCAARGNVELLESRLRLREDEIADLRRELADSHTELHVARREAVELRRQLTSRGEATLLPEQAELLYRAEGIRLSSLMTGGLDRDGRPGDDHLLAVVVPHDADGEPIRLPGAISLEALDLSRNGDERIVGRWEFDVETARGHWHRGLFASGYQFELPWQSPPQTSQLLVHARLTTTDGRQFDATREIHIDVPLQ